MDTVASPEPIDKERILALAALPQGMPASMEMLQTLWGVDKPLALEIAGRLVRLSLALLDDRGRLVPRNPEDLWTQFPDHEVLDLIHSAHQLGRASIAADAGQYASQIVGRLLPYIDRPSIQEFLTSITRGAPRPWLRPTQAALTPAGTALVRTYTTSATQFAVNWRRRILVTGHQEETLRVWDLDSGVLLHDLVGDGWGSIDALSLSADGRIAAAGGEGRRIRVWDLEVGRQVHLLGGLKRRFYYRSKMPMFRGTACTVTDLAVSADGQRLISACEEHSLPKDRGINSAVEVWDLRTGETLHTLIAQQEVAGYKVAISSDGSYAMASTSGGPATLWDLQAEAPVVGNASSGFLTPRGERIIRFGKSVEVRSPEIVDRTPKFERPYIAASEDGRWVAFNTDGLLQFVNIETGTQVDSRLRYDDKDYTDRIGRFDVDPMGRTAVTIPLGVHHHGGPVRLWDLRAGNQCPAMPARVPISHHTAFSEDGSLALTGPLAVWDLRAVLKVRDLRRSDEYSWYDEAFALSEDGRVAVAKAAEVKEHWRNRDGYPITVWDVASGAEMYTLLGHSNHISCVKLAADGRTAVSSSWDNTIQTWDLETGKALKTIPGIHARKANEWDSRDTVEKRIRYVSISRDGTRGVSIFEKGDPLPAVASIHVWDLRTGRRLRTLVKESTQSLLVEITPDGRRAVSASRPGSLSVWDLEDGRKLFNLGKASDHVNTIAISKDGNCAAATYEDLSLRWWDLTTGTLMAAITLDKPSSCCAFVSGGILIAIDHSGCVHKLAPEAGASHAGALGEPASSATSGVGTLPQKRGFAAGAMAWLYRILQPEQKLALIAVLIPTLWSLKTWVNESYFADWWFQWRNAYSIDFFLFIVLLFVARASLISVHNKFGKLLPRTRAWVLVLPLLALWIWSPAVLWLAYLRGREELFEYRVAGKIGCQTAGGKTVLPAEYDYVPCTVFKSLVWAFFEGRWPIPVEKNGKWGFLDQESFKTVIDLQFDSAGKFTSDGLAPAQLNGKWGLIGRSGKPVIPFEYDGVGAVADAKGLPRLMIAVKVDDKWGYIDRRNQIQIPFEFDEVGIFMHHSLALLVQQMQGKSGWGIARLLIPHSSVGQAWCPVRKGNLWAIIDYSGAYMVEPSMPFQTTSVLDCDKARKECIIHDYVTEKEITIDKNTQWNQCSKNEWTPENCAKVRSVWP